MSNSSRRLSRGDRRRNDRLAALRAVIARHSAVLAFDLAADKQVCALTDQDSRVLARRTVKVKAWQLAEEQLGYPNNGDHPCNGAPARGSWERPVLGMSGRLRVAA